MMIATTPPRNGMCNSLPELTWREDFVQELINRLEERLEQIRRDQALREELEKLNIPHSIYKVSVDEVVRRLDALHGELVAIRYAIDHHPEMP